MADETSSAFEVMTTLLHPSVKEWLLLRLPDSPIRVVVQKLLDDGESAARVALFIYERYVDVSLPLPPLPSEPPLPFAMPWDTLRKPRGLPVDVAIDIGVVSGAALVLLGISRLGSDFTRITSTIGRSVGPEVLAALPGLLSTLLSTLNQPPPSEPCVVELSDEDEDEDDEEHEPTPN